MSRIAAESANAGEGAESRGRSCDTSGSSAKGVVAAGLRSTEATVPTMPGSARCNERVCPVDAGEGVSLSRSKIEALFAGTTKTTKTSHDGAGRYRSKDEFVGEFEETGELVRVCSEVLGCEDGS